MFIAAAEIEKKNPKNEKITKTNQASYQKQVNMAAMCLILGKYHKNLHVITYCSYYGAYVQLITT